MAAPAVNPFLRRSVVSISGLIAVLAALSCSDSLLGGGRGLARVVLQPQFSQRDAEIFTSLQTFGLGVTSLHVALIRPNTTDTVAQTTIQVDEGQDEIEVSLDAAIQGSQELLTASLEMTSGSVLVFSGSTQVLAKTGAHGATTTPVLVPVWVGPGKEATSIVISPRDLTLPVSGTVTFSATAFDANQQPVTDPDFVSRFQWRVTDPTLGSIPATGGAFVAAGKAGTALVTVFTPNLLRDTVRLTLVSQLPLAKVKFVKQLEVLDNGANTSVPVLATDANGATIGNAVLSYVSRTPGIASVSPAGTISGLAKGQAVILVRGQDAGATTVFQDSLLAVVADPAGPVLISSIDKFELTRDATMTVSIFMDMRSTSKLGSTAVDVNWNPAQLLFQSFTSGASGVAATVNTAGVSTGQLKLAMADVAGFPGRVELLRITFKTSASASTGQLALTASELAASDFADLISSLVQVSHPLVVP